MVRQLIKELSKNKLFAFLNIIGVALTIAVIMLWAMKWENDLVAKAPEVNLDRSYFSTGGAFKTAQYEIISGSIALNFYESCFSDLEHAELSTAFSEDRWLFLKKNRTQSFITKLVDSDYFLVNEFSFLEGEAISKQQFENQENVLIISERVRDAFFNGKNALAEEFVYQKTKYKIIGVVENVPVSCENAFADFWKPRKIRAAENDFFRGYFAQVIKRNEATLEQLQEEIDAKVNLQNGSYTKGEQMKLFALVSNTTKYLIDNYAPQKYGESIDYSGVWKDMLLKFTVLLLIPAISLVSVNMIYIQERAEEIAIRKVFGASRFELVKQLFKENLLQTFLGGMLGLISAIALAYTVPNWVFDSADETGNVAYQLVLDVPIFLLAILFILLLGSLSGIIPAVRLSRLSTATVLKGGEV